MGNAEESYCREPIWASEEAFIVFSASHQPNGIPLREDLPLHYAPPGRSHDMLEGYLLTRNTVPRS